MQLLHRVCDPTLGVVVPLQKDVHLVDQPVKPLKGLLLGNPGFSGDVEIPVGDGDLERVSDEQDGPRCVL